MSTLRDLKRGESARVSGCSGEGAILQRLCELGFVPGTRVRVVGFAPFGDPMAVEVDRFQLSLRKAEAALVTVDRI